MLMRYEIKKDLEFSHSFAKSAHLAQGYPHLLRLADSGNGDLSAASRIVNEN
jgi:hypothetical protein